MSRSFKLIVLFAAFLSADLLHSQIASTEYGRSQERSSTMQQVRSSSGTQGGRFIVPIAEVAHPDATPSSSISISGNYAGTTSQPANTLGVPVFQSQFSLTEDSSGHVTGTRYDGIYGTAYFAIWSISGTVSGNSFTFSDQSLQSYNTQPGTYWCQIAATLTISADGDTLTGPWTSSNCGSSGYGNVDVSRTSGKLVGSGSLSTGDCQCGDPIDVNSGNIHEQFSDYTTSGANQLQFIRYYNSRSLGTYANEIGTNWRTNYDRYLQLSSATVVAERGNGQQITFSLQSGKWTPSTDTDLSLSVSGSTWTLTDSDDTVETYKAISSIEAIPTSIQARNGYKQSLTYNGSNNLTSVTDSYNRSFTLTYSNGLLQSVTTPEGTSVSYSYSTTTGGPNLVSVTYPDNSEVKYVYDFANLPSALTGITDENGNSFAAWTYDDYGRGLTSQHNGGADLTTVTYDDSTGNRTVTNALGVVDTYTFTTLQGSPKVSGISRASTSTTAAATEAFTYDSNGYLASKTDWNGNQTTYVNNPHGLPTTIVEGAGSSVARTTTITYDSTWVHLPSTVVTSGVTTSYTYDSKGEVLTKKLSDTTSTSKPYSTSGQARTWTNTWSNSLLASISTPNGNKTSYGYDGTGALTSITDPKGNVTQIGSHTGGGLPLTIKDPNSVTTTITYSPRMWRTSSTMSGTSVTYKTTWTYDAAGNLAETTLPDNSFIKDEYDDAHRLVKITDADGNYTSYTLDANGDRAETDVYNNSGTATMQRKATYDALGRLLTETGGAGESVTKTYDANGNVLTIADGLGNKTTNVYDALNRLTTSTDANNGVTTRSYDAADRILSVTDANKNATTFTRDGFGEVIQQVSPDSGTTVYHYDSDGNLTSKTDALGIVVNQTFDSLDRIATTTYPADTAENVTYTYDQTGTGYAFGIGRLTSVKDAAGTLTRAYEQRGLLASEVRTNGSSKLTSGYTYDGAGHMATMTYPDGTVVTYTRDTSGYISQVAAKLPGASSSTTLAKLTHQPFGPINSASFGNGISEQWSYDTSYRAQSIVDSLSGSKVQSLSYTYDKADNVSAITDAVNAANSQTFKYDVLNRLTSATSATNGYGSLSWTYDAVGNRLTEVQNGETTNYTYTTGTNRLASINGYTLITSMQRPSILPARRNLGPDSATTLLAKGSTPDRGATQPKANNRVLLSMAIGWPMFLGGLAGIGAMRKRLYKNDKWLGILVVVAATGFATLLVGCGSGGSSSGSGGGGGGGGSQSAASTPTFSPAGGNYTSTQSVTISDATSGAAIYYTTDGSTPTTSSSKYSSAISVAKTQTLNAIAVATGYTNSSAGTATYNIYAQTTVTVTTNANGNITSIPPANSSSLATFAYNNANRMSSVTGSPQAATFVYDWEGQRIAKTDSGSSTPVLYSYAPDGSVIAENNSGVVTDYVYADGRPIAVLHPTATPTSNQVAYILADRLGTPQIASNTGGSTVWSATYQPFGTTVTLAPSISMNLRFSGQLADGETGFSYNSNRNYMTTLGRYLEVDPLGVSGSPNVYAYTTANPVKYLDPRGLWQVTSYFPIPAPIPGVMGKVTFGYNSGQINWGSFIGGGSGWGLDVDLRNTPCTKSGWSWGLNANADFGPISLDSAYSFSGSSEEVNVSVSDPSSQVQWEVYTNDQGFTTTPIPGVSWGEGGFVGIGVNYVSPINAGQRNTTTQNEQSSNVIPGMVPVGDGIYMFDMNSALGVQ